MKNKLDLGKDNIKKLLFTFSIPCIISMLINSIYNIVDQIFIGQGVGYLGNAATNVIFPLVVIFNSIALLIGNGSSTFFSLKLGEKDYKKAKQGISTSIVALFLSSIILASLAYVLLPNLINLFGCTENVYNYALDYGRIIVLGLPFMVICTGLSAIIRADGSPKYSMISISIGAILNIILDPIFIFDWGLGLGIKGGALATIIGQFISCIVTCAYLFRFKSIKLELKDLRLSKTIFKVLGCGLSSFITQTTVVIIFIVMNNVMTTYGIHSIYGSDIPLSVFGIVSKLNQIFIGVIVGLSNGAQPIIGYNYGAGNYSRVRETIKKVIMTGFCIGLFFTVIFVGFPRQAVSIFGSSDNELYIEFATKCCRIFLLTTVLNIFQISTGIILQSLGKVAKAAFTSVSRQILLFVPLVLIMSFYFGLDGALWAEVIANTLAFMISTSLLIYEYKSLKKHKDETSTVSDDTTTSSVLLNNNHIVITINREFGSGGRYVGKLVANLLGIKFYDKELIKLVAEESGFTESYIEQNEQKATKFNLEDLNNLTNNDQLYIAECNVIKKIAKENSCVIIGRCSDYILKDEKNVIRIFIYSDEENKLKRATNIYNLDEDTAKKEIKKKNELRANHYKYYTGRDWKDFNNYELVINSDYLGVEETAKLIKEMVIKKINSYQLQNEITN